MRKRTTKKLIAGLLSLALLFSSSGIEASAASKVTVKLNKTKATVTKGKKVTLKVTTKNVYKVKSTKWSTSKKKVATVTSKGVVKGVKAGSATISCTVKYLAKKSSKKTTKKVLKCKVTVKKASSSNTTTTIAPTTDVATSPGATVTVAPTASANEDNTSTTSPGDGDGSQTSTTPPSGDDGSQTSTTPPSGDDGSQTSTTPPSGDDGSQTSTNPPSGDDGSQTSTTPPSDGSQTSTPPPSGSDDSQTSTTPPSGSDDSQTSTPPPSGSDDSQTSTTPPDDNDDSQTPTTPPSDSDNPETPEADIAFLPIETDWTADWNSALAVSDTTFSQYSSEWLTGKRITINYTINDWTQLGIFAGNNEYNDGLEIKAKDNIDSASTNYSFDITEEIAAKLLSGGLYIMANQATLDSISIGVGLTIESDWVADWNSALAVSDTSFSEYTAEWLTGKKITINYTIDTWTQLGVFAGNNEYNNGLEIKAKDNVDSASYSFDITKEIANQLISGGLYIMANQATLDLITITPTTNNTPPDDGDDSQPPTTTPDDGDDSQTPTTPPDDGDDSQTPTTPPDDSDDPQAPTTPPSDDDETEEDIAFLTIETDWTADWNSALAVSDTTFGQYSSEWLIGKRITINYTINDWTQLGIFAGNNEYNDGLEIKSKDNVDSASTNYSFDITEEIAAKLLSGGLYIMANQATLNSISIGVSLTIETDWTADWNSVLAVSDTSFSEYTVEWLTGKRITINYTINDWTQLGIFAGNNEYNDGLEIKSKDNVDSSSYSFDITKEIAEKLLSGGLYIMANQATIDSITIIPIASN